MDQPEPSPAANGPRPRSRLALAALIHSLSPALFCGAAIAINAAPSFTNFRYSL